MKSLRFHTILATCLALSANFILAQENEDYSGNSRKTMRVIAMSGNTTDAASNLYYEYKGKKSPLYFTQGSLSTEMPTPKGKTLNIYQEIELPVILGTDQTKTEYNLVGAIPLVSSKKSIVVISIPLDLTKNKIRGRSFKDSYTLHPEGKARVFNLSPKAIAISAGKHSAKIAAGDEGILNLSLIHI